MDKFIIRTSDRKLFRTCRTRWDFGSKIRENYEYVPGVEPLDFGVAIHAALEIYYDPERWQDDRLIVQNEAILAFNDHMDDWKGRLKRSGQWDLKSSDWSDLSTLGHGMLHHYYKWAPAQDLFWEPVKVEVEFEVPIPVPESRELPKGFRRNWDGNLEHIAWIEFSPGEFNYAYKPVVYQGRIDLIWRNLETDKVYIEDHKTRGKFDSYDHYELDTQCSSYCWVLKTMLNIDVAGVIFQELRKKAPEKPRVLKSGKLSKDMSQSTTVELYKTTIKELGLDPTEYEDFLIEFGAQEQEYFRRIQVDRNAAELEIAGLHVLNEAIDMLSDPYIYPNPDAFNCNGCTFKEPCMMRQEGSDWKWQLDHSQLYEKRS